MTGSATDSTRFTRLWVRCGGDAPDGAGIFVELAQRYGEAGRHYHTLDHIRFCLGQYQLASEELGADDAVELALWFHDVIYEPGVRDNESRSIAWFKARADNRLTPAVVGTVARLITATEHVVAPSRDDEQLIVDIDLAGFGQPPAQFAMDSRAVRDELAYLDDAAFAAHQSPFLQRLLNRPRIYHTAFFYRRCEVQARQNIPRQIEWLASTV